MGNQHSAPDKDKERERDKDKPAEKEKDKNQDPIRPNPRHEKHRSRTITASPLPPTETKVNAEQTPNNNGPNPTAPEPNQPPAAETPTKPSGQSVSAPTSPSVQTTPVKERAMAKTIAAKDVVEGVKNIKLEYLPKPANEEEIKKEAAEMEPTPKFETMRASSQTSIVDEEELKEADKSGLAQVPLVLDWNEGGKKVAVAGTFTGWRKRVNLRKTNGGFSAILQVRPGTHRFHFLVDGEWRISNDFATAVDSEGNLLNYLEASEYVDHEDFDYSRSGSISWPEPETPKEVWTRTIPAYVARASDNPTYNGRYSSRSSLVDDDIVPPALPRQLEKPFLNQNHIQKDDQSVLPNPAHVVLNHLGVATSIKDNVLAVSSTNRYRQKYVTSILYKQVDEE